MYPLLKCQQHYITIRILSKEVQVGFSPLKLLTGVVHLRGDIRSSYCLIREGGRERELPLEGRKGDGGGGNRKRRKEGWGRRTRSRREKRRGELHALFLC